MDASGQDHQLWPTPGTFQIAFQIDPDTETPDRRTRKPLKSSSLDLVCSLLADVLVLALLLRRHTLLLPV